MNHFIRPRPPYLMKWLCHHPNELNNVVKKKETRVPFLFLFSYIGCTQPANSLKRVGMLGQAEFQNLHGIYNFA